MTRVEIIDTTRDQDFDPEDGRWVTYCTRHQHLVSHATRALARSAAREPEEWCGPCSILHGIGQALEAGATVEQAEQRAMSNTGWGSVTVQDIPRLQELGDWPLDEEYPVAP